MTIAAQFLFWGEHGETHKNLVNLPIFSGLVGTIPEKSHKNSPRPRSGGRESLLSGPGFDRHPKRG